MESAYAASLPPRERRLAGRLEGFGDIVFGFAVSQCALQLPMVGGQADLSQIGGLVVYFGTFALLASLWMTFHAMMSGCFRPAGFDRFLAFTYLAFVTLMPYALYGAAHSHPSVETARSAVGQYAAVFATLMILAAVVTFRNLRRGWPIIDEGERVHQWQGAVRRVVFATTASIALIVDLKVGPLESSLAFMSMIVLPRVIALFTKVPPSKLVPLLSGEKA